MSLFSGRYSHMLTRLFILVLVLYGHSHALPGNAHYRSRGNIGASSSGHRHEGMLDPVIEQPPRQRPRIDVIPPRNRHPGLPAYAGAFPFQLGYFVLPVVESLRSASGQYRTRYTTPSWNVGAWLARRPLEDDLYSIRVVVMLPGFGRLADMCIVYNTRSPNIIRVSILGGLMDYNIIGRTLPNYARATQRRLERLSMEIGLFRPQRISETALVQIRPRPPRGSNDDVNPARSTLDPWAYYDANIRYDRTGVVNDVDVFYTNPHWTLESLRQNDGRILVSFELRVEIDDGPIGGQVILRPP